MISRWFLLTLLAVVFAPGLLHAQPEPAITQEPHLKQRRDVIIALQVHNEKMYEDIEIMRRILGRKLQSLYPRVSIANVTPNPFTSTATRIPANKSGELIIDYGYGSQPYNIPSEPQSYILASPPYKEEVFSSLEGVYLNGQGVVYTATLSSLQPPAKAEADNSDKVEYEIVLRESEWDGIRRQVRNEKEKPKKPEESKPPSLSDVLLKVLAENGHHFSQLGENESLTIVLTVHEGCPSPPPAKSAKGSAKTESKLAIIGQTGYPFDPSNSRDLELLGDLHLKQGRYEEAIAAFVKAVESRRASLAKAGFSHLDDPDPKQAAALHRKLAQCYLALEKNEKARAELDGAITLLKKETEAKGKPAAAKPAAALPVKLIISAPKKLLDQVKEGKMSFEELRRLASVETLRFGDRR